MPPVEPSRSSAVRHARFASAVSALLFTVMACRMDVPDDAPSVAADSAQQVSIGEVSWYVDYDAAVEVAKREDKALWVHFGENPG